MSKNNLKRFDKEKDTIRIEDFVTDYLNDGIPIKCRRLTHKDLKQFNNPYVITISYEIASSNLELILTNKIILVRDRCGNVAPYINPKELKKLENLDSIEEKIRNLKRYRINQLSLLLKLWREMQVLLYEKRQLEEIVNLLKGINKQSKIDELGGKSYVKEYQRR